MLKLDRCKEERLRLGQEADNMCRWFGKELKNTELALSNPNSTHLLVLFDIPLLIHSPDRRLRCQLQQYCSRLRQTEHSWANSPFAPKAQYQYHVSEAESAARHVGHASQGLTEPIWVTPVINHNPTLDLDTIEEQELDDDHDAPESDSDAGSAEEETFTDDEEESASDVDPEYILQQQIAEDEVDSCEKDDPSVVPISLDWRAPVCIVNCQSSHWYCWLKAITVFPFA
jgi:hypothetical protein